jgi:hypothetical protein
MRTGANSGSLQCELPGTLRVDAATQGQGDLCRKFAPDLYIEFCEAEHRRLLKMVTSSQVDLAWISERVESVERELHLLRRDLETQERRESEEWN